MLIAKSTKMALHCIGVPADGVCDSLLQQGGYGRWLLSAADGQLH